MSACPSIGIQAASGLHTYDSARWSHSAPRQSHVVPIHDGVGFLLQSVDPRTEFGSENVVTVPAFVDVTAVLVWRKGARQVDFRIAGQWQRLRLYPRDGVVLPAGASSDWVADRQAADQVVHLHLDHHQLAARAHEAGIGIPAEGQWRHGLRCQRLDRLIDYMLLEVECNGEVPTLTWTSIACLVQLSVLRLLSPYLDQPAQQLSRWQERRCIEYLTENLAEEVSLAELAAVVGLSPFHFARQFKRSLGLPPHAYQVRLRCEKACELLRHSRLSVLEVAQQVGYGSAQAFARSFRRQVGCSPAAWRRQQPLPYPAGSYA